ncbi:MAG: 30S ribosomal protein S14 [Alphaproteobacteria bacterium]|nr:30S ribosomal protein S14 [Alphaproteobacteria bacterium]
MAKLSSTEKNARRARLNKKYAGKRAELKKLVMNKETTIEERFDAVLKLAELPRNSAKNRLRNRCGLSGRPRGFFRKFKLSRIAVRDLASNGQIPGIVKSSW